MHREFSKSPIPKKHFLVPHRINVSIMVYQFYKMKGKDLILFFHPHLNS